MAKKRMISYRRQDAIIELLVEHRGKEEFITSNQLKKELAERGFEITTTYLGILINKAAFERNLPICYANGKGYYWASCKAEVNETIADLQSRINAMQKHINHLKKFLLM